MFIFSLVFFIITYVMHCCFFFLLGTNLINAYHKDVKYYFMFDISVVDPCCSFFRSDVSRDWLPVVYNIFWGNFSVKTLYFFFALNNHHKRSS